MSNENENNLEIFILTLLQEREYHGYELYEAINMLPEVDDKIKYGRIFAYLYMLLQKTYIIGTEKETKGLVKVYYAITETGLEYLGQLLLDHEAEKDDLNLLESIIDE